MFLAFLIALNLVVIPPPTKVVYTPVRLAIFVETPIGIINVPWTQGFQTITDCESATPIIHDVLTRGPDGVKGIRMMSCYIPNSIET